MLDVEDTHTLHAKLSRAMVDYSKSHLLEKELIEQLASRLDDLFHFDIERDLTIENINKRINVYINGNGKYRRRLDVSSKIYANPNTPVNTDQIAERFIADYLDVIEQYYASFELTW